MSPDLRLGHRFTFIYITSDYRYLTSIGNECVSMILVKMKTPNQGVFLLVKLELFLSEYWFSPADLFLTKQQFYVLGSFESKRIIDLVLAHLAAKIGQFTITMLVHPSF